MQTLARFLLWLLVGTTLLRAGDSLSHARNAQTLLGSAVWSRVIAIENRATLSRYPAKLHALVFELGGILWFYCDVHGTQSFSLYQDRLDEEKSDFGPLLRDIEPGFSEWKIVPDARGRRQPVAEPELPNGCFIQSVAAAQQKLAEGVELEKPRLLSYYRNTSRGRRGHTVLTYLQPDGIAVLDPTESDEPRLLRSMRGASPINVAEAVEGTAITKARWIPLAAGNRADESLQLALHPSTEDVAAEASHTLAAR